MASSKRKVKKPKSKRKIARKQRAATIPAASLLESIHQEQIDSMRAMEPPATPKPIGIAKGVYQTRDRSSALVYQVTKTKVLFVSMRLGWIDHEVVSHDSFAHDFCFALPDYPIRKAARIYLRSFLTKSEKAERVLRSLIVS